MTRFNTGNPVGSADPRDRHDNSQAFDRGMNSESPSFNDRFGRARKSWQAFEDQVDRQQSEFNADQALRDSEHSADQSRRENEFQASQDSREGVFNAYLVSAGYQFAGDYTAGIQITQYNQVVRDTNGELWRASGSTTLPYTTTGAGLPEGGAFVNVGDAVLRQDLANNSDPAKGSAMVGHAPSGSSSASTVKGALDELHSASGAQVVAARDGQPMQYHIDNSIAAISTPTELYRALSDPLLPMPVFFDGWNCTYFNGVNNKAPLASGIPTGDTNNDLILEYTVTGAAGDTSLTITSGDEALGGGEWGAVIQHDDGTYGLYTVYNLASGTCSIHPKLKATTTNRTLRNLGAGANGQHMTRPAYKALARAILSITKQEAYRGKLVYSWAPRVDRRDDWTAVNVANAQWQVSGPINNFNAYGWRSGDRYALAIRSSQTPYTGRGAELPITIPRGSGFIDLNVSSSHPVDSVSTFVDVRVELEVGGVNTFDQIYDGDSGLQRVIIPYEYNLETDVTLRVTRAADEPVYAETLIDRVLVWQYDRPELWGEKAFDLNAKTVVIGDSWTQWADQTLSAEIEQAIAEESATGTVVNVGLGGQKADWGLKNFEELVVPEAPEQVLIHFYINDYNALGLNGVSTWLQNIYLLARRCQQIGARPIIIMPLPTQSIAQSVVLSEWRAIMADALGKR